MIKIKNYDLAVEAKEIFNNLKEELKIYSKGVSVDSVDSGLISAVLPL